MPFFKETNFYFRQRDEASVATVGNVTYILGGIGERTVEYLDMTSYVPENTGEKSNLGLDIVEATQSRQIEVVLNSNTVKRKIVSSKGKNKDGGLADKSLKWKLGPQMPNVQRNLH